MTRTLPWKRATDTFRDRPRPSVVSTSGQDNETRQIKNEVESASREIPSPLPSNANGKRPRRSGSTSPPPLPLSESFMREGLNGDDRYRMVEDEFLSTAQQFTAHMHAAEYQRLKASSKALNANTIRNISRPVVGNMTDLVRLKQERKKRRAEQRLAIKKATRNSDQDTESGSSDNGGRQWDETTLHGLMASPRKKARRLDAFLPCATTTRAAAGFDGASSRQPKNPVVPSPQPTFKNLPGLTPKAKEREPETTSKAVIDISDSDDDDLDTPTRVFTSSSNPNTSKTPPSVGVTSAGSKSTGPTSSRFTAPATSSPLNQVQSLQSRPGPAPSFDAKEEADNSSDGSENGFLTLFKKRRQSYKTRQEEKRKRRQSARASSASGL